MFPCFHFTHTYVSFKDQADGNRASHGTMSRACNRTKPVPDPGPLSPARGGYRFETKLALSLTKLSAFQSKLAP